MTAGDALGWIAAALTLLTFSMRSMVALRMAAVAASLCFIAYGALGALYPVLALHLLLLPCNLLRLAQLCRGQAEAASRIQRTDLGGPCSAPAVAGQPASEPRVQKPDALVSIREARS